VSGDGSPNRVSMPRGGRIKPDTIRNILIKDVLQPLTERFPAAEGEKGFPHGRLHSFRHFFCSQCANKGVAERVVMDWLGHADAAMVRRYYHIHAQKSRRQLNRLSIPVVAVCEIAAGVKECSWRPIHNRIRRRPESQN